MDVPIAPDNRNQRFQVPAKKYSFAIDTATITNVITNVLQNTPFSVALENGTILLGAGNVRFPETSNPSEPLQNGGGKTFTWRTDLYGIYTSLRLVFYMERNDQTDNPNDPITTITARVCQDPPGSAQPVGTIGGGNTLSVGAVLAQADFSTTGSHFITFPAPTGNVLMYVHFIYTGGVSPIGGARVKLNGIRYDFLV